jgi:hypothetical protein
MGYLAERLPPKPGNVHTSADLSEGEALAKNIMQGLSTLDAFERKKFYDWLTKGLHEMHEIDVKAEVCRLKEHEQQLNMLENIRYIE